MKITIKYKGVEFDVEYDYQPAEKAEKGPEAQYPGCGEQVEICEIKHNGICFFDLLEDNIEEIEDKILDKLHND